MKTMKQKTLFAIALLMGLTAIISCEDETDLKRNVQYSTPIGSSETGTASISNGFSKEALIQRAYNYYATTYNVELTPKNTKVINETTLNAWVEANKKNKHKSINQKNQAALEEITSQGDFQALLVTAPAGAKFSKSVFIAGSLTNTAITDIIDIFHTPKWYVVKEENGLNGCNCVEEYKFIGPGETANECNRCPDLDDDLPKQP